MHPNHARPPHRRIAGDPRPLPAIPAAMLAAGVALTPLTAAGQEAAPGTAPTLALPEISVTATRTPRRIDEIGSALTVITREELENRQTLAVSDALRSVPGVSVTRTGPLGTLTEVRIRGAEANQTLVLIDGIQVNDPANGLAFDFGNLLVGDIERIEVLRGPQSALYGSEAIGGVVNIVTHRGDGPIGGRASVEAGSFGTVEALASVDGGDDDYAFNISANALRTEGVNISDFGDEDDGFRNLTLNATGRYSPTDFLRFDLAGRYTDSRVDNDPADTALAPPFFITPVNPDTFGRIVDSSIDQTETEQAFANAQATLSLFDGRWEQIVGASIYDSVLEFESSTFGPSFAEGTLFNLDYQSNVYLDTPEFAGAEHVFTILAEREEIDFSNINQTGRNFVDYSIVGQYQVSLIDRIFLTGSVRHDFNDLFEDDTTYRATAAYLLERTGTRFHASYGTGTQQPTPIELFGFGIGTFFGNPDLRPETSRGWDIGVEQSFLDDRLALDATYFENDIEDEINGFFFDPQLGGFTAVNRPGTSETRGVELTATWRDVLHGLDLSGSYTYTDATQPFSDADGSPGTFRQIRQPMHTGNFTANYRFLDGRANLNLSVDYVGERRDIFFRLPAAPNEVVELDAYTLVDLAASYRLSDNVELFGRIENLLDEDYEEVFDFNQPGIGAFAGIRMSM
jgi:vitamin B12 transporter